MRKRAPMPNQLTFARADELAMLRRAVIKKVTFTDESGKRRTAKPKDMGIVLRVLDDHGQGCWPSLTTIAAEARMGKSTASTAIKGLQELGVLVVERFTRQNGNEGNRYVIVWNELGLLCPPNEQSCLKTPPVLRRDGGRSCMQDSKRPDEAPNEPPPPTPSSSWRGVEDEFRGQLSIASLIDWAAERGYTPQTLALELRQALQTARLPANAQRLESPEGAAVAFLRNGRWPVDGIIGPADSERQAREAAERDRLRREFLEREAALDRQIAAERAARQQAQALEATA